MTVLTGGNLRSVSQARRYTTARSTVLVDRMMSHFIKGGGILVIIAVLGIFVFILGQILPLFRGAHVSPDRVVPLEPGRYLVLGIDEWAELPFALDDSGRLHFVDLHGEQGSKTVELPFPAPVALTAFSFNAGHGELAVGTGDGRFSVVHIAYASEYPNNQRRITAEVTAGPLLPIGPQGARVASIAYADAGSTKIAAGIVEADGRAQVHAVTLSQRQTMMGSGELSVDADVDLTPLVKGTPKQVRAARDAECLIVSNDAGEVFYFRRAGSAVTLEQTFKPFGDLPDSQLASIDFLFGDLSLVLTNGSGVNRIFSLFVPAGSDSRRFGQTKEFPSLPGAATFYTRSQRNKAFLIGSGDLASLRYATTETIRWEERLPFTPRMAAVSGKDDRVAFLDDQSRLHLYDLDDKHPEASAKGFFGKLWYEGATQPEYKWQSTGGSDDFEPKLSLVPLIIGTLKGTFYALLIALPIALLAAMYTSQFAHPSVRAIVKPTMEIMASLPSVVLGFLAALWLAPILETRVPSILLMLVLIPAAAMTLGIVWTRLPWAFRSRLRPGSELIVLGATALLTAWICWELGPFVERAIFVVHDPTTGAAIADFRKWWPEVTGTTFQQRNSLVVGFMMGFAVIPIIFTISEDSLSNVPASLRSGSLALGASRWQTAIRIVLPTASAGIFSALMVGLGRAVGETMIVLMATGNTPIMDFNIFSGMRTLSANIATELPEAPQDGTLYRTLFLGAMVLFLMTFAVNTLAELLRQRLRARYRIA